MCLTCYPTMAEFGDNLAGLMAIRGINQVELSKLSGVDQSLISKYLRGDPKGKNPSLDKLLALATALTRPGHRPVDTLAELLGLEKPPAITDRDLTFIKSYKQLDDNDPLKAAVDKILALNESDRKGDEKADKALDNPDDA